MYTDLWEEMCSKRELVARVNPLVAAKAMMGMVQEKYHAMEHRYPAKADIIDAYGYDGKQVHHLLRDLHQVQSELPSTVLLNKTLFGFYFIIFVICDLIARKFAKGPIKNN